MSNRKVEFRFKIFKHVFENGKVTAQVNASKRTTREERERERKKMRMLNSLLAIECVF